MVTVEISSNCRSHYLTSYSKRCRGFEIWSDSFKKYLHAIGEDGTVGDHKPLEFEITRKRWFPIQREGVANIELARSCPFWALVKFLLPFHSPLTSYSFPPYKYMYLPVCTRCALASSQYIPGAPHFPTEGWTISP